MIGTYIEEKGREIGILSSYQLPGKNPILRKCSRMLSAVVLEGQNTGVERGDDMVNMRR